MALSLCLLQLTVVLDTVLSLREWPEQEAAEVLGDTIVPWTLPGTDTWNCWGGWH